MCMIPGRETTETRTKFNRKTTQTVFPRQNILTYHQAFDTDFHYAVSFIDKIQ